MTVVEHFHLPGLICFLQEVHCSNAQLLCWPRAKWRRGDSRNEARLRRVEPSEQMLRICGVLIPRPGRANQWRRGDSKPKSQFTKEPQQPYSNDTESSQVQTVTDLTNQVTEQILTDSIQNHNTNLHGKYAICMHQNNITLESLPPDLTQIVTVWSVLPEDIKITIKMLIETASK